jgi:hypothetical protein
MRCLLPVRRLNFTARQRIAQSDVDVILQRAEDGPAVFNVVLDLSLYEFPFDARVFVEAYRQTTLMRFDFGSVSAPTPPMDRSLVDFPSADEILFRVRVTATSGLPGVLLGEADQIRPHEHEEQRDRRLPLLPVIPDDLGEEVWRVDFNGGTMLLISRDLPNWKQTVSSDTFRALVYPAAMREILERILLIEGYHDLDDPGDWRSRWLLFGSRVPGSRPVPKARDAQEEWIEDAVAAFARHFHLRSRYITDSAD